VGEEGLKMSEAEHTTLLVRSSRKASSARPVAACRRFTLALAFSIAATTAVLSGAPQAGAAVPGPSSLHLALPTKWTTADEAIPGTKEVLGHSLPSWVRTGRSQGETTETIHWNWTIPSGHLLLLPAFRTQPGTSWVMANSGTTRRFDGGSYMRVVLLHAQASEDTGYGSFVEPSMAGSGCVPAYKTDQTMVGWPEGNLFRNNVAAPLFSKGHFSLTATITNGSTKADYHKPANVRCQRLRNMFPWVSQA
jgi:hypothetical protein